MGDSNNDFFDDRLTGKRGQDMRHEFTWQTPPNWKYLDELAGLDLDTVLGDQLLNPELERQFATQERGLRETFARPYGSEMGAEERAQGFVDARERLNEAQSAATEEADFNRKRLKAQLEMQRKLSLAQLSRPELTNTRDYGYGPEQPKQGGGFWGQLAGAALGAI